MGTDEYSAPTDTPLLVAEGIVKDFPGVRALNGVDFNLRGGEVHALVGENGAGKSTLIKIIAGIHHMDEGELHIYGTRSRGLDAQKARDLGISVVFQELSLIQDLSVAENIFLGREVVRTGSFLDRRKMVAMTAEFFERYGIDIDPYAVVAELSAATQQLVEIAKALLSHPGIIIMDEPTASLSDAEGTILFRMIDDLKRTGAAIVFVSHRMDEIFAIADRISVLRDGTMVADEPTSQFTLDRVVRLMVGRAVELYESSAKPREEIENREIRLEVRGLTKDGLFSDISFDVRRGEILGVTGLVGSGRSEVMQAVFGVEPYDGGHVFLDGAEITIRSVDEAISLGLALLPENRKRQGLVLMHNLVDNVTLATLRHFTSRVRLLEHKRRRAYTKEQVKKFGIKPGNVQMLVRNLSGGNQQKVCISKWLAAEPQVLIVDEPTVGIDVRTKSEIHRLLRALTDEGVSIIMVSSEMQEVLAHSDRVMVMNKGRILGTYFNEEVTQEKVMSLIMSDILNRKESVQ